MPKSMFCLKDRSLEGHCLPSHCLRAGRHTLHSGLRRLLDLVLFPLSKCLSRLPCDLVTGRPNSLGCLPSFPVWPRRVVQGGTPCTQALWHHGLPKLREAVSDLSPSFLPRENQVFTRQASIEYHRTPRSMFGLKDRSLSGACRPSHLRAGRHTLHSGLRRLLDLVSQCPSSSSCLLKASRLFSIQGAHEAASISSFPREGVSLQPVNRPSHPVKLTRPCAERHTLHA